MPDAAPASHAGNSCTDKITHPFYRLNLLPIPSYHSPRRGARPLCYFLGEKVTQKHFHTAAPLGRQYESAFARSRGGSPELPAAAGSGWGFGPASSGRLPRGRGLSPHNSKHSKCGHTCEATPDTSPALSVRQMRICQRGLFQYSTVFPFTS